MSAGGAELGLPSLVDVCLFIDGLPAGLSGEIRFSSGDGTPTGAVLVEGGRVCWAAARGLSRRLADLMAASAALPPHEMEATFLSCRERGVPLGEHLVASGLLTAENFRSLLLTHSTESLRELCVADASADWVPREGGGYSPRFTFLTGEVLAHALRDRPEPGLPLTELEGILQTGDWGAVYRPRSPEVVPDLLAVYGAVQRVDALMHLGRWACSALDATQKASEGGFVAGFQRGGVVVAWRAGDAVLAGSTTPAGPARLMNRLARARHGGAQNGDV